MYLIDTSAFSQARVNSTAAAALDRLTSIDSFATCVAVSLELLYSAKDSADFSRVKAGLNRLEWLETNEAVEKEAIATISALARRGHHRRPGRDLLIAAAAAVHGATVVHYDHDFDLIAEVTGQPTQWIIPRGTGH